MATLSSKITPSGVLTPSNISSNSDFTVDTTKLADRATIKTFVPAALNATGTAPLYACRAWVNFNGSGTVAIRASGNVSSITDNGTGVYTVNFTTAMPDVDYSTSTSGQRATGGATDGAYTFIGTTTYSTTAVQVRMCDRTGVVQDASIFSVAVFR